MTRVMAEKTARPDDRRVGQRFNINAPVALTIEGCEIPAYTRDMSSRGLYFYVTSAEGFTIGQILELSVTLPPEITLSTDCSIQCRGRLVRIDSARNDVTGIAAEIIEYSILSEPVRKN